MSNNLPEKPALDLPTLTPEAIAQYIAGWPKNVCRYVLRRLADPDAPKTEIMASIGLTRDAVYRWYHGTEFTPMVVGFRELDQAIDAKRPWLRQELAYEVLQRHAPLVAERMVDDALMEDTPAKPLTDRRLQVRHQAQVKVLEATGVIQKAPTIVVDNRRVDAVALQAWQDGGARAWQAKRRPAVPPIEPTEPTDA